MPGLNQRGPENRGPMTGRKMGRCVAGNAGPNPVYATGYGQGRGCGAAYCRAGGRGRGFGPRAGKFAPGAAPAEACAPLTEDELRRCAKALEQELDAVKNELKTLSEE